MYKAEPYVIRTMHPKHVISSSTVDHITVSPFIREGQWNETLVRQHVPPLLIPLILNTKLQLQEGENCYFWKRTYRLFL